MPSLVIIFGRDRGRHFDLSQNKTLIIGRGQALRHRLNDPSISRQHLSFTYQPHTDSYRVDDLGSRNGARLNNERLNKFAMLEGGDIIQIGYTLLVFVRVTFDARDSIDDFLDDCEHTYADNLEHLRTHASMHLSEETHDASHGSLSGTMALGSLIGRRH